jgi:hypothetical protein
MKTATLNSDEMLKTMVAEAVKQQTQIRSRFATSRSRRCRLAS